MERLNTYKPESDRIPYQPVWGVRAGTGDSLPVYCGIKETDPSNQINLPIDPENTISYHNVGDVISRGLKTETSRVVQDIYGPRALALLTRKDSSLVIGPHVDEHFLKYQSEFRGHPLASYEMDFNSLNGQSPVEKMGRILEGKTLRVYMPNSELIKDARAHGAEIAGWNERNIGMLEMLNNKNEIIHWLRSDETEDELRRLGILEEDVHAAPKSLEVNREDVSSAIESRITEIHELYEKYDADLRNFYEDNGMEYQKHKPAVMVRPSWGGGNYDSLSMTLESKNDDGEQLFTISFEGKKISGKTIEQAKEYIDEHLSENGTATRYTITRKIQVINDPGINIISFGSDPDERNRWCYVAPNHGQNKRGNACIGTTSRLNYNEDHNLYYYDGSNATDPDGRKRTAKKARMMAGYVGAYIAKNEGNGVVGIDVMEAGFFERALAHVTRETEDADKAVGSIVVAETNMRPTQRTMHTYTQIAILRHLEGNYDPVTYRDLIQMYEMVGGGEIHFTSEDKHHVTPEGWEKLMSTDVGNSLLAGINGKAEGVYVIMPPITNEDGEFSGSMGIGIMADTDEKVKKYEKLLFKLANGEEIDQEIPYNL